MRREGEAMHTAQLQETEVEQAKCAMLQLCAAFLRSARRDRRIQSSELSGDLDRCFAAVPEASKRLQLSLDA